MNTKPKATRQKLTDDEAKWITDHCPTMTVRQMSETLDRHDRTIRSFLIREKLDYKRKRLLTEAEKTYIGLHYPEKSHRRIAEELGVTYSVVAGYCFRQGITIKGRRPPIYIKDLDYDPPADLVPGSLLAHIHTPITPYKPALL